MMPEFSLPTTINGSPRIAPAQRRMTMHSSPRPRRPDRAAGRRQILVTAAVAAAALALAGCSSSGSGGHSGKVSASTLASLRAVVTKAETVPNFTPPGPVGQRVGGQGQVGADRAGQQRDRRLQHPGGGLRGARQAARRKVTVDSNSGKPTQWVTGDPERHVREGQGDRDALRRHPGRGRSAAARRRRTPASRSSTATTTRRPTTPASTARRTSTWSRA